MPHRTMSGRLGYYHRQRGETGREQFTITQHADGVRTLRALCEMDDDAVLRDVTFSVGADWRPLDAFIRLTVRDRFVGASWFRFHAHGAECEGFTAADGRFSQRIDSESWPAYFGTHSLVTDGWHAPFWREDGPPEQLLQSLVCSHAANGATGPVLSAGTARLVLLGRERLRVPAGEFDARHFTVKFGSFDVPMHFWVTDSPDHLILKIDWDHLDAYYELLELQTR
jgi:hypothetical protein